MPFSNTESLWSRAVARVRAFVANASITRKLLLIAMVPTLASLLLASALLFGFTLSFLNQWMLSEVDSMARMVSKQLSGSYRVMSAPGGRWTHQWYPGRAEATLHLLDHSRIHAAALYDGDGQLLAKYFRDQRPVTLPQAPPGQSARWLSGGMLHVFHPIEALPDPSRAEMKTIGTLYMRADVAVDRGRVLLLTLAVVLIVLLSTSVAYLLSLRLQRIISAPITHLALLARLISEERDYSLRAVKQNDDDIGRLVDEFNGMLERIEEHRQALQHAHDRLEERVQARTEDLQRETLEHKQTAVNLQREIRVREATEQKLKQAKGLAEAASHAKGEFVAHITHEIRTPMNGILGMAELLRATPLTAPQRRYLETIQRSGNALLGIVGDVLDHARIEAGQLELAENSFDLHSVCEDVLELLSPQATTKDVALILRYAPDAPRCLLGDAMRISQILTNLAANALRFTDTGHVLIDVACVDRVKQTRTLRIFVEDTGIGASREQIHRIFGEYVQADSSIQKTHGGTGLGLAISRSLVELMGGSIGVQSKKGVGSRFIVTVPLSEDPGAVAPRPAAALEGVSALILDANAARAAATAQTLESWGMAASHARTAAAAAERAAAARPDLVLVETQGLATAAEACAARLHAQCDTAALVLITSNPEPGQAAQMHAAGYAGYLSRPARETELGAVLERVLARGRGGALVTRYIAEDTASRGEPGETQVFWSDARVLVVDDSEVNREVATQMLKGFGCRVAEAEDGLDAVHLFEQGKHFDLVLMDCQMDHLDGYEATRRIRALEAGGTRVPIIAMTAMAMSEDRERCLASGMDDYLLKPFNPEKLTAHLRRCLPKDRCGYRKSAGEAPPEPAPKPDTSRAQADELPAFDIDRAMWVTGGNEALFHRSARIYLRSMPKRIDSLGEAIERDALADIQNYAHSIKGSSVSVGGERLRAAAGTLELAARAGDLADSRNLYAQIRAAFDALQAELTACIPAEDTEAEGAP